MGLFKLLKKIKEAGEFTPDFNKSEYENQLDFLDKGGNANSWDASKTANNWSFKLSEAEVFEQYQKELKPISNKYYGLMEKIQKSWSVLYNLNDYTGSLADRFEKDCLQDILYYKRMREIDIKYGEKTPTNIPAFKRLAMLYEKQGKYENAVTVCKEAISFGMDEKSRMIRMIKKAGRTPTAEEMTIL